MAFTVDFELNGELYRTKYYEGSWCTRFSPAEPEEIDTVYVNKNGQWIADAELNERLLNDELLYSTFLDAASEAHYKIMNKVWAAQDEAYANELAKAQQLIEKSNDGENEEDL